ncbi:MAG: hypothetical protein AAGI46_06630 [Planctomycetota bacterium]
MSRRLEQDEVECFAFAVMPDHLHCVISRGERSAEQMMTRLKAAATWQLIEEDRHPLAEFAEPGKRPPKVFAKSGRKRFLFTAADVERTVLYVNKNPVKAGLPPQNWGFIATYQG